MYTPTDRAARQKRISEASVWRAAMPERPKFEMLINPLVDAPLQETRAARLDAYVEKTRARKTHTRYSIKDYLFYGVACAYVFVSLAAAVAVPAFLFN